VLPIQVPPLRDRLQDLDALVDVLAEDIARRSGLPHKSLSPEALDLLAEQAWPGNIRELRNVLEQATLMTDDTQLGPHHFAAALRLVPQTAPVAAGLRAPSPSPAPAAPAAPVAAEATPEPAAAPALATSPALLRPLQQQVDEVECAAIASALQATGGNRLAAARLLKMSRAALYDKLARHPELSVIGR
jgi:DNA-binding NtrC family response regulator